MICYWGEERRYNDGKEGVQAVVRGPVAWGGCVGALGRVGAHFAGALRRSGEVRSRWDWICCWVECGLLYYVRGLN